MINMLQRTSFPIRKSSADILYRHGFPASYKKALYEQLAKFNTKSFFAARNLETAPLQTLVAATEQYNSDSFEHIFRANCEDHKMNYDVFY